MGHESTYPPEEVGAEPWRRLEKKVERVGKSLRGLATEESVAELRATLDVPHRIHRNPYLTLAAAAGAGYVLGGGLSSWVTRVVLESGLRLGLQIAVLPLLKEQLEALVLSAPPDSDEQIPHPQGEEP
jgi:hypothetical protein